MSGRKSPRKCRTANRAQNPGAHSSARPSQRSSSFAIWFPIRLIHELLKAIDFSEKPDHTQEARELFREAYSRSCDLPSKSEFARSVLDHAELPPALHDALFEAFRALYARKHDAHGAADPGGLGKSRRHPLARPHAPRDRPHECRGRRQDAPRLHRGRERYRRRGAQAPRRRRDHLSARHPRQARPLRRRARSPARRPALPRVRRNVPRQHVPHLRRPARQTGQAAETR